MKSLSVVFPARNEENIIQKTVERALEILPQYAEDFEVIVVNDGSNDRTGPICDELARKHPLVTTYHHPTNLGYGAALKTGIRRATKELIFFTDSDGQFDLNELSKLLPEADAYDIVAGYRGKRQDPWHRLLNAWGWKMVVRTMLGIKLRDIDCAFKLFDRAVFDRIKIRAVGAMVNTEIFAQAAFFDMTVKEVCVTHYERRHGQPTGANPRVIIKAFRELILLRGKLRRMSADQLGLFHEQIPEAAPEPCASREP